MRSRKKSQVHSQFNWMFVLIVGGFFIVMFFAMSTRQADTAQRRISASALEGISNIFEAARTGNSMSSTVSTPELKIEFSCETGLFDDQIYSEYRVGGFSRRIDALPTFAPGTLEGDNLITWTNSWNMPFNVMNFLFIANQRTRFFFISDDNEYDDLLDVIEESISSQLNVEFLNSTDDERFGDYNDEYNIVVVFSDDDTDISQDRQQEIYDTFDGYTKITEVVPESDPMFGKVIYYDEDINLGEVYYAGRASFYGAIFSPDQEFYECSMRKALERFARVACIHQDKARNLHDHYGDDVQCFQAYGNVLGGFEEFHSGSFCEETEDGLEMDDISLTIQDREDLQRFERLFSLLEEGYDDATRFSCSRPY